MNRIAASTAGAALLQLLSVQPAMADDELDRFFSAGYTYCDAVVLGQFWGESGYEAKITVGRKIGWGNESIVQENAAEARGNGLRCTFADTEFSYDDAEVLAKYWEVSVDQAKAALTEKASHGMTAVGKVVVGDARAQEGYR